MVGSLGAELVTSVHWGPIVVGWEGNVNGLEEIQMQKRFI